MKQFKLISLAFSFLASCQGQVDKGDKYNTEFTVGNIPSVNDFLILNKSEKSLDSKFNSYDKSIDSLVKADTSQDFITTRDFVNNRSRILLKEVSNGKENIKDEDKIEKDGFSTFCDCGVFKDTLFINSGIGFFGGVGISVKVFSKQFKSAFYEYIDDVKPYKLNKNSEFTDNISIESKYQYLLFDSEPTNKEGQQLTGFLTLTSNDFFENRFGEKLDTNYVKAQLKFTCKTKKLGKHP